MKSPLTDIEKANKAIRNAWIGGIIVGVAVFIFVLPADPFYLIDVFIIFGLTFGVYKKNRASAVMLFLYFIISKIFMFIESGNLMSLPLALILSYLFFDGLRGTFSYHKITKAREEISNVAS